MRQELIQQTQDMAATATAALDSILALRTQLFATIDAEQEDTSQAERLAELENQLRDLDLAIGQVRIYLLGFHRTLANAQTATLGNVEISHLIAKKENSWILFAPKNL